MTSVIHFSFKQVFSSVSEIRPTITVPLSNLIIVVELESCPTVLSVQYKMAQDTTLGSRNPRSSKLMVCFESVIVLKFEL